MSFDASPTYRFDDYELDSGRFELRRRGEPVHLEPQVLSVLLLLASNHDRLVSRDELIEKVWGGRFISDAAVASRVKSARRALGDDGKQQRFIRTVHARGFRFVGRVAVRRDHGNAAQAGDPQRVREEKSVLADHDERPSITVLPFRFIGQTGPLAFVADALADEIITDLARLRWLFVISRNSSFRFRDPEVECRDIGQALDVQYCLSGAVEAGTGRVSVLVQLARTSDSAVLWTERFTAGIDELQDLRQEIVTTVIASLELRIAQHEAQLARATEDAGLDAWSAYHLGIERMFRFNRANNARAAELFERALVLRPEFGRALGGLSFTRFQDAFLQYSGDPAADADQARSAAERAVQCDPLDPFAYLNLGRSLWLKGEIAESIELLRYSIALNPNCAQAVYSRAWAEMTQCEPESSEEDAALALRLSPLDPLRYAMLGVRSVNALLRGDYRSAAEWGERAGRSPGAHKHISVIAALGTHAAGRYDSASDWIGRARERDPAICRASFLQSFPFAPSEGRERIEASLRDLGL